MHKRDEDSDHVRATPAGVAAGVVLGTGLVLPDGEQVRVRPSVASHAAAAAALLPSPVPVAAPVHPTSHHASWLDEWHNPDFRSDFPNMIWLTLMYVCQGVPLGLVHGSIPFLLQRRASYTTLGILSMSNYPYSLKLLWSPLVDSIYNPVFGRRKSWIVPLQLCSGLMLLRLSYMLTDTMEGVSIRTLFLHLLLMVWMCATQDIAVDGWAITMLSARNKSYGATCQSLGLNTGYFLSFTIFLALNSPEFSNRFLRADGAALPYGVWTLPGYLRTWGVIYLFFTLTLWLVKHENPRDEANHASVRTVYRQMWQVLNKKHMRSLVSVLLLLRLGFVFTDYIGPLKLIEKGFKREDLAAVVLLTFPLDTVFAIVAGRWSNATAASASGTEFHLHGDGSVSDSGGTDGKSDGDNAPRDALLSSSSSSSSSSSTNPITSSSNTNTTSSSNSPSHAPWAPYLRFYKLQLFNAFLFALLVHWHSGRPGFWSYAVLVLIMASNSFAGTIMSVTKGGFFNRISDDRIGGTYLTLLNTVSNLGSTWPKFFAYRAVDWLSRTACLLADDSPSNVLAPPTCDTDVLKAVCVTELNGTCHTTYDPFITLTLLSLFVGASLFPWLQRRTLALGELPKSAWMVEELPTLNSEASSNDE